MQYKIVEIPKTFEFEGTRENAISSYESFLNSYAVDGWKFDRTTFIYANESKTVKSGCGKKKKDINTTTKTEIYVAVFIKE